jgi:SOS response associated peptidase (SRAP)
MGELEESKHRPMGTDVRDHHCANLVGQIHDRMPAILEPKSYERWLGPETDQHDLLMTYPSEPMVMWPISTRVNSPDNDDASLLDRTTGLSDVWAPLEPEGISRKRLG